MSAAYNQVPRLSTGLKMMGHHHHPNDQMQLDGGTQPAPFAADHPNAKQRKWRVLVSIGLLLPALAAIIGIVAWTISIEVANGNQQNPISMAQRRSERAQMEQFRRDEALALAALVAARRSARHSHTMAATGSAPQLHQKQQQQQAGVERVPAPLAEAIVAQPNSVKVQRSMALPTTRPTRSNPQQQQPQAISSNKQQPQHQMSKNSDDASSIMLKNREQTDNLSNDSSENQEPTASASSQAANFGDDEEPASGRQAEQETKLRSQQTDSQTGSEASRDAEDSASNLDSQPSHLRAAERIEQRPVDAGSETENERGIGSQADAEPAPAKKPRQSNTGALKEIKSRWLNGKRPSSSVSRAESSVTPVETRKLSSAKDNHSRAFGHKGKQQETVKSVKSRSKYTLLPASDAAVDAAAAAADNNDGAERPSASSSTRSLQPAAESPTEERDNEQQEPRMEDSTTTTTTTTSTTTTTQPSTSDCHERVEQESRASKPTTGDEDEDEDISFEAIASAISKTLSADEQPTEGKQSDASAEQTGDLSATQEDSASSGNEGSSSESSEPELAPTTQKRRRTTGEHLAEVIDHLVDRRKQHHEGSRFGDRAAFLNDQERSQLGPQIVVVAPVGPSGALLKARSLTKAEEPSNGTTSTSNSPVKAPSNTKAGSTKSGALKKSVEALKKQPTEAKSPKPIGGRLIGVGPLADSSGKYSERVEVIEDDDSSSLLLPQSATSGDQAALEHEHVASIHVSSHSGEPRFRSPRHEQSSSQMFERYASVAKSFNGQPERRARSEKTGEAKLYSAEQLIRNHILRSKANNSNNNNRPVATYQQQPQQPMRKEEMRAKQEEASSTQLPPVSSTSTQSSTSANPPTSSRAPEAQANRQQQRQQEQEMMLPQQSQQQQQRQFNSGVQPVAVPAFYMQQQQQQQFNQRPEAFQVMESQQQQMRVEPPQGQREYFQEQQQQREQADSQQQQQRSQPQSMQMQAQMQQQLPTFADQEIQVPAHMAESVIRDLQQSASSVTGMLHGQPMVFQALPPDQQPRFPAQFFHNPAQAQTYHRFNSMMPSQQHQQQQQYQAAESQQWAQFALPHRVQSESAQAAASSSSSYSLNPFALVSRLVGSRRQQTDQKRKEAQDRQVLANRDSAPKELQQPKEEEKEKRSSRFIGTVKSFGPRSLVQPVAQLALKQVISSIGQHAEALEQQAAAQQAEADAAEQAASQQQQRHSPTQPQRSSAPQTPQNQQPQQQVVSGGDAMQSSGSSPVGMAALPPPGQRDQLAAAASGRSMRSLPIGAQAPASQQQVQIPIADQEVQESYGQMPAYHMPDNYNGGGGGGGYHPPGGYGGAHYESPDKKSKGITFHFGGGPVGGGTQLITSPMGIFKHLMIPLTRSQTSLNGKLVFGVVLEKTTHTNVLPKKKHKYWGR